MITSKSCDGTPMNVKVRTAHTLPQGIVVRGAGRAGHEFLVKLQFLRGVGASGSLQDAVLLEEAMPLMHGKKVDAILAACLKGWVCLRQSGHTGLCIEHYAWDRMGLTALERTCRQWHAHQSLHLGDMANEAKTTEDILRLSELVVVTPCAAHDAQNAFRWGMGEMAKDKNLLRDVYVGIESLRNSLDLINRHVAEWVARRLSYREHRKKGHNGRRCNIHCGKVLGKAQRSLSPWSRSSNTSLPRAASG